MGQECPSDSDPEETLTDPSPTAETSSDVQDESIRNQVTDSVENCNYLANKGGGRARLSVAHSDVLFGILQHVASARGHLKCMTITSRMSVVEET